MVGTDPWSSSRMSQSETTSAPQTARPRCDHCGRRMKSSGWTPRPNGQGGLHRMPVFACLACDRTFDAFWGYRESVRIGAD
jgi:hypothetical protein